MTLAEIHELSESWKISPDALFARPCCVAKLAKMAFANLVFERR